jgi:hypothetical protein
MSVELELATADQILDELERRDWCGVFDDGETVLYYG